jgi:hypothetical protein
MHPSLSPAKQDRAVQHISSYGLVKCSILVILVKEELHEMFSIFLGHKELWMQDWMWNDICSNIV